MAGTAADILAGLGQARNQMGYGSGQANYTDPNTGMLGTPPVPGLPAPGVAANPYPEMNIGNGYSNSLGMDSRGLGQTAHNLYAGLYGGASNAGGNYGNGGGKVSNYQTGMYGSMGDVPQALMQYLSSFNPGVQHGGALAGMFKRNQLGLANQIQDQYGNGGSPFVPFSLQQGDPSKVTDIFGQLQKQVYGYDPKDFAIHGGQQVFNGMTGKSLSDPLYSESLYGLPSVPGTPGQNPGNLEDIVSQFYNTARNSYGNDVFGGADMNQILSDYTKKYTNGPLASTPGSTQPSSRMVAYTPPRSQGTPYVPSHPDYQAPIYNYGGR